MQKFHGYLCASLCERKRRTSIHGLRSAPPTGDDEAIIAGIFGNHHKKAPYEIVKDPLRSR